MDWEDLKTFLAVARHGNLSAGARSLGVSQTTMGRRIEGLQDRLGAKLLQRTPSGFILTPAGEQILAAVERMESEAHAIEGAIKGKDVRLEGVVRITTVEAFGAKIITPALAKLQASHPGIAVELITDDRSLSLARGRYCHPPCSIRAARGDRPPRCRYGIRALRGHRLSQCLWTTRLVARN